MRNQVHKFQQADGVRRASANIEGLPGGPGDSTGREFERIEQIVDKQNVAHLHAIAVDRDGLAGQSAEQKVGHPALVFIPALPGTVNAAHAEYRGGDPV